MSQTSRKPPSLHGAKAKLDRSQEHFDTLAGVTTDFFQQYGNLVTEEFDPVDDWTIGRFRCDAALPLRWSTIFGDAIHNTRAALDHVVYQLVVLSGNNPRKQGTNPLWPVVPNKDEYWKGVGRKPPVRDSALQGVAEEYRKLIDPFQPDPGDENHPILIVNRLANADKHRVLHLSVVVPGLATLIVTPDTSAFQVRWKTELQGRPLNNGVELYRWRINTPEWPKVEVKVESTLTFGVAFGKVPTDFITARRCCRFIYEAVRQRFDPLFPTSAF